MALIEMKFFSQVLGIASTMNVILPEGSELSRKLDFSKPFKYQTLYLLHGGKDDQSSWIRQTAIERYATKNMLAVVMPNCDLSYYTDMAHGRKYWTFLTEEIPLIARRFFPLSDKREDNFVAGLSMGGYGSFKWAFKKPEMFAAAASLSGTLDMPSLLDVLDPSIKAARAILFDEIFGDYTHMTGGEEDLMYLATVAKENKKDLPMLYQACGTEDFTYSMNIKFRDHLRKLGIELHYEEAPGTHEWGFWDTYIQKALAYFPLKKTTV